MIGNLPVSAPKAPGLFDRCVALEHSLTLIPQLRAQFGITRIADTTYLDRTGIPTFSAIVPESPDLISVYSGKGSTREAALCSAVMEAVERQCAAAPFLSTFECSAKTVQDALDLETLGFLPRATDDPIDCVWGTDIVSGAPIAVPMALVKCPWFGEKLFTNTNTNGLATGNNLTEAIYHALSELIERHVWSMYHARSHLLPGLFFQNRTSDFGFAREVIFPTGNLAVDELAEAVRQSGLQLRALHLPEGALPATMVATTYEPNAGSPMMHMGFGSSLSPSHALIRAITESVQSRVVDIQGAREDVVRSDAPTSLMSDHARRPTALPFGRWYFDVQGGFVALASIPDRSSLDLAEDLACLLRLLQDVAVSRVVVVDLSPAEQPVCVVRVIVPELETTLIDGRIGPRIRDLLNPFKFSSAKAAASTDV